MWQEACSRLHMLGLHLLTYVTGRRSERTSSDAPVSQLLAATAAPGTMCSGCGQPGTILAADGPP